MLAVDKINSFYGGAHILHDLSLTVGSNEVVALLGRNGAGKSTTIKSIIGLVRPESGRVSLDETDISGLPPYQICRAGIGYVPEERRIFAPLTVEENLEVGRREPRDGSRAWSRDRLFELFPNLAERRNALAGQLSGGEQQMLTIARTLMGNPRVVLLDEPSEGLAPLIVEQMAKVILEMKRQGLSLLVSEQNMHFARLVADRAYIIEKGAIRHQGTFAELDANPEIARLYLAV